MPHIDSAVSDRISKIESDIQNLLRLQKMILLSAGGSLPVTVIGNTFTGATIDPNPALVPSGDKSYFRLYENNLGRLLACKVVAAFNVPGSTVNISITNDPSGNGIVETLASTGKIISDTIWVKPNDSIYINTADTAFSLYGSTFRVLVFDPLSFQGFLGGGV